MNKLYVHGCWQKRGRQPRKHHSITDIKKGYAKQHRGLFEKVISDLRKKGLVATFPHHGDKEHHVCAILEKDVLAEGIELANIYRMSVGLPLWNDELNEIF